MLVNERRIDLLNNLQNRFRLKGRAVQSMLNLGEELGVQSLGIQTSEDPGGEACRRIFSSVFQCIPVSRRI